MFFLFTRFIHKRRVYLDGLLSTNTWVGVVPVSRVPGVDEGVAVFRHAELVEVSAMFPHWARVLQLTVIVT